MRSPGEPSGRDVDVLLPFLAAISREGFSPGRHHAAIAAEASEDGEAHAAWFEPSPELDALLRALHEHGFVYDFDWPEWQSVADRYVRTPALLADAGLGTIRKLFTTAVRKNEYAPGHLVELVRSGHLLALLQRLRDLRPSIPG